MDHDGEIRLERHLQLLAEDLLLGVGDQVETELTDRDHARAGEPLRHAGEHLVGEVDVVRLSGVHPDGAVVLDAVLRRALRLEGRDVVEVVVEGAGVLPRLPEPERGLGEGDDPTERHPLVVVGHPRDHVGVWIENAHWRLLRGNAAPAASPADRARSQRGRIAKLSSTGRNSGRPDLRCKDALTNPARLPPENRPNSAIDRCSGSEEGGMASALRGNASRVGSPPPERDLHAAIPAARRPPPLPRSGHAPRGGHHHSPGGKDPRRKSDLPGRHDRRRGRRWLEGHAAEVDGRLDREWRHRQRRTRGA